MNPTNYVITGTTRGIGLDLTRTLAGRGKRVFALARDPSSPALDALAREYPDTISPIRADVTDEQSLSQAAAVIGETAQEGIDVLVNNAGVLLSREAPDPRHFPIAELERTLQVNTVAPLRVVQAFLGQLERRVGESSNGWRPRVVHISSIMGSLSGATGRRNYSYSVSKAALNMLGKLLSYDLDLLGIDSFLLHPGWVRTDMGGSSAHFSVEESAAGIADRIDKWRRGDASFLDFLGKPLEW